jgi:hypothetical protein
MRINYQVGINRISYLEVEPGQPPVRVVQFINPATSRVMRVERLVLDAGFPYPVDRADQEDE